MTGRLRLRSVSRVQAKARYVLFGLSLAALLFSFATAIGEDSAEAEDSATISSAATTVGPSNQLYAINVRSDGPLPTPTPSPTPTPTPQKPIYLTFDDGPADPYTLQIVNLLNSYGARGTFFMLGANLVAQPQIAATVAASGHAIGNHTYHHRSPDQLGLEVFFAEVLSTQDEIKRVTGVETHCFRPPYGAHSPTVLERAASLGLTTILWDIDTQDWRRPGASAIANHVISRAYPGAIVLMHDGGGDRSQTVQALGTILAALSAQGYDIVALDC